MPAHLENESSLVAAAQEGNSQAFTTLVYHYEDNVYRVALNITGNHAEAEDVLQETFLKAYTHVKAFQGRSRFYTWLVRIAVNEALMKLRQRRGHPSVGLDELVETDDSSLLPQQIADWGDNPEQRFSKTELQQILVEAIERLEPPYRIVFLLRDVEKFSTDETAQLLGLSVSATKSRLLRGRLKLREYLSKYFKRG